MIVSQFLIYLYNVHINKCCKRQFFVCAAKQKEPMLENYLNPILLN